MPFHPEEESCGLWIFALYYLIFVNFLPLGSLIHWRCPGPDYTTDYFPMQFCFWF